MWHSVFVVLGAVAVLAQSAPAPSLSRALGPSVGGGPPECGAVGGRNTNVWERAKSPDLRRYCDFVASAASKLAGTTAMAQLALAAARKAEQVRPGFATPRVLEGRALVALGNVDGAFQALTDAKSRDAHSLDEPLALFAWARVLARTGHRQEAADAYRSLLPRANALSAAERSVAEVEAGLVAMTRGETGLDEAVAGLREALRDGQDETRSIAVLALALALDRHGETEESRALLEERAAHGDPRVVMASPRGRELLEAAPAEMHALAALALETSDAAGAHDEWQKVLTATPDGPWAAHAHAHLEGGHPIRRPNTRTVR